MGFDYLKKFDVRADKCAEYTIAEIDTAPEGEPPCHPVLQVKPATEANAPYYNAYLRKMSEIARSRRRGSNQTVTVKEMDSDRAIDRSLFGKYIVSGWRNVPDENGEPVEFSAEVAQEFIEALPAHVFDGLRAHCKVPENFTAQALDAEAVAKN